MLPEYDYKSELLCYLMERGYVYQATDLVGMDKLFMAEKNVPVYIGFDCTAESLHVGSLIQIMLLRAVQKFGHKPIMLFGGGTTKIGDPSGKDETRKILSCADIDNNVEKISVLCKRFFESGAVIFANNEDWWSDVNYIDFLRKYGLLFSVNRMISFDSVKTRLDREQSLTFLEFNYLILQAYDFVKLHELYGCCVQFGGSDQWGNIVSGIELGRKLGCKNGLFGMTTELLVRSDGKKMGKSESGAVWLDPNMCTPYDMWQYFRNVNDNDVIKFLKLLTDISMSEINKLSQLHGNDINEAKKILADEVTSLCHGKDFAIDARKTAEVKFEKLIGDDDLIPKLTIKGYEIDILAKVLPKVGIVSSNGEAKKLIEGGAVRINSIVQKNKMYVLSKFDINDNGCVELSVGKKKFYKLIIEE